MSGGAAAPSTSSGLPSMKWLKEWFAILPAPDSDELIKKFNSGSWVREIGNFDPKHKSHLQKLHEIAFPFHLHHSSSPKPPPEPPKKIPLENMTASELIEFIKEKEKDTTLIDAKEQKLRVENAGYRKQIEEYLKLI